MGRDHFYDRYYFYSTMASIFLLQSKITATSGFILPSATMLRQKCADFTRGRSVVSYLGRSRWNSVGALSMSTTIRKTDRISTPSPSSPPPMPTMKVNLQTIEKPELKTLLVSWGEKAFRADQIMNWIRVNGAMDFDEMSNLPKGLLRKLKDNAVLGSLEVAEEQLSKDGTIKRLYRLWDGQLIESVLMPYEDGRVTACISSQAGCAMGCVFCATGQMGFARQLTADEIFEQVARFATDIKSGEDKSRRLSNVVMMGMGEPLGNYRNLMAAIARMNGELGIGARKITVSTVGVVPNIRKLIDHPIQVRLAVSLHCAEDKERSELMPANKMYGGLSELMSAVREYTEKTKRRMTFEWALIEGKNDTPEVARQLGNLIKKTWDSQLSGARQRDPPESDWRVRGGASQREEKRGCLREDAKRRVRGQLYTAYAARHRY
mmetsp:Transcript_26009/g.51844  ORF Transcript_26009/g.51844 Transcript_26009/m.51844 type:complete len:435 (+) Transcript_26009:131-1435(+)